MGYAAGSRQDKVVVRFEHENETESRADSTAETDSEEKKDKFYQDALTYNRSLVTNGQDGMTTRDDVEEFALDARDYGYSEDVIGTIEIPRLDVKLGLYLGANYDSMDKGVAVFGMTSLPLGAGDENVAIAGHRGWRGTPVFRDIQLMQENDPIYVTTPWRTLVYRVSGMEIVTPEDNSWCKIQKGKTMLSLMTCHPYGDNYQRYIVFAELTDEKKPFMADIIKMNKESFDSAARQVTMREADGSTSVVSVEAQSIEPDGREYGAFWSNVKILAEKRMKPVAAVAAVVVILTGAWLTYMTIRQRKRRGDSYEQE